MSSPLRDDLPGTQVAVDLPDLTRASGRTGARRPPAAVLLSLLAGNERFVNRQPWYGHDLAEAAAVAAEQQPGAVVVGCMDSRVPLEAIFDQTFGSICVARSAGQVLDRAVLGSVEFAVSQLRVSLVVVLGHERCGAIAATVDALRSGKPPGGALDYLVNEIAPEVHGIGLDHPEVHTRAMRGHVRATVRRLRAEEWLVPEIAAGEVDVVGAVYNLDTGRVEVLD